jgi:hypothetical protein
MIDQRDDSLVEKRKRPETRVPSNACRHKHADVTRRDFPPLQPPAAALLLDVDPVNVLRTLR